MDTVKILYSNLLQEKTEKEFTLQILLNTPANLLTQIEDCKKVIIEIANINSAISTLDELITDNK